MTDSLYTRKKHLLEEMKWETLEQLRAIQEEDVERFLERVEKCERLIELINEIDATAPVFPPEQTRQMKNIVEEILHVRQQITPMLQSLHAKLQKLASMERQQTRIRQSYGDESIYHDSIFFDKKN